MILSIYHTHNNVAMLRAALTFLSEIGVSHEMCDIEAQLSLNAASASLGARLPVVVLGHFMTPAHAIDARWPLIIAVEKVERLKVS